jgi:hypothetical protein
MRLNDGWGYEPISAAHPQTLQAPPLLLPVDRPSHRLAEAALIRGLGAPGGQLEGLGYVHLRQALQGDEFGGQSTHARKLRALRAAGTSDVRCQRG